MKEAIQNMIRNDMCPLENPIFPPNVPPDPPEDNVELPPPSPVPEPPDSPPRSSTPLTQRSPNADSPVSLIQSPEVNLL